MKLAPLSLSDGINETIHEVYSKTLIMSEKERTMSVGSSYQPATSILSLGEGFYDQVEVATFPKHLLRFRNQRWAERMGLDELTEEEWLHHFAQFAPLPNNLEAPLALRYHGHQFRQYNPELGDGRGFLYAQLINPVDGRLLDLGTKGSGTTPYSRSGDGRLTLKGGVRELLATKMLEALGVSTSKTFSLVETGEHLHRNDEPSPTRSCVMTRLSHSHIRFGTFQQHAFEQSKERLQRLLAYTIQHFYPHLEEVPPEQQAAALLKDVVRRCADTCAGWMTAGFVHGVLNTDNMNITGESFDYGPYRFTPTFDPSFVAAYFDYYGLYAFGQQSDAVHWNLQQLAIALRPLSEEEELVETLKPFPTLFEEAWTTRFLERLGVKPQSPEKDRTCKDFAVSFLEDSQMTMDQFFFDWYGGVASKERAQQSPESEHYKGRKFLKLDLLLNSYQASHPERLHHPYFQGKTPCSMHIDEVEEIWSYIDENDDWLPLYEKLKDIRCMGEALNSNG